MTAYAARTLNEALHNLELARIEMFRPEEEVVSFSACHYSRISIRRFLEAFLEQKNIAFKSEESNANLLERCKKINPVFSELDVSVMECRDEKGCGETYCLSVEKVKECLVLAEKLKKVMLEG